MTERETPDSLGFLFGGMTDDSSSTFAPLIVSEPDFPNAESPSAPDAAPAFLSRREARAAGAYRADAARVAAPEAAASPVDAPQVDAAQPVAAQPVAAQSDAPQPAAELSTQAMAVTEIAEELATPVAKLTVHQRPITAIAPAVPAPALPAPHAGDTRGPESRAPRSRSAAGRNASGRTAAGRSASGRTAAGRKSLRQRVTGFGVMLLVGGLFAVLALPAYADNNASALTASAAIRTQKLAVSAQAASAASATDATRDSYTATSALDLKALYSSALKKQNLSQYLQSGAKASGDDYPWFAELSRNQGGGLSPLNYYYRECVDFVAWRLNRDAGDTTAPFKWTWATLTPNGGNASQWKSAWLNHGWPTGTTPQVGAVAWFTDNHVGYVSGILNDGSVLIEEYNWQGQHLYGSRVIQAGDAYYLYAPPA